MPRVFFNCLLFHVIIKIENFTKWYQTIDRFEKMVLNYQTFQIGVRSFQTSHSKVLHYNLLLNPAEIFKIPIFLGKKNAKI